MSLLQDRVERDALIMASDQMKGLDPEKRLAGKGPEDIEGSEIHHHQRRRHNGVRYDICVPEKHTRTGVTVTPIAMRRAQRRAKNKAARQTRKQQARGRR